jgi:ubiquinol-cytochrome c reductase cytochrome c subunit
MKISKLSPGLTITAVVLCFAAAVVVGASGVKASSVLAMVSSPSSQEVTVAEINIENGKNLYLKFGCWTCHGYAAQGGPGRRLAPNPIALPVFTRIVRRPPYAMPPYTEKVVTDQELADIHAYLEALPPPPDYETILLLKEADN